MKSDLSDRKRTPSPRKAFRPINTLSSPQKPVFGKSDEDLHRQQSIDALGNELPLNFVKAHSESPPATFQRRSKDDVTMVRERSPHKAPSTQYLSPQKKEGEKERTPLANISAKMQSPSPKAVMAAKDAEQGDIKKAPTATQPEFGKASPLRNPLRRPEASIFIPKPKPKKLSPQTNPLYSTQSSHAPGGATSIPVSQRPFYLPGQQKAPAPSYNSALEAANAFSSHTNSRNGFEADFFEIAVPKNAPLPAIRPKPRPTFSSLGPNTTFEPFQQPQQPQPKQVVDLTSSPLPSSYPPKTTNVRRNEKDDDAFDPDAYIAQQPSRFGEPDLDVYTDPSQADKNIKNLLEGAFDDDEDKSRTRIRRRAKRALKEGNEKEAKGLAGRLAALSVKNDSTSQAAGAAGEDEVEEEEEEDDGTVEGLNVKLLPHQVEGVAWMIDKEIGRPTRRAGTTLIPRGGILADDMGLGKTIQSMTLILTNSRPAPDAKPEFKGQKLPGKEVGKGTLVVAPLALIKQWEDEIKTKVARTHALRVLVHHGPSRTKSAAELKKYDVVITTYQTLTSEHAASSPIANKESLLEGARIGCMGVSWYRVILDEAHSIKNRSAKAHQAACALQSHYRWCLTGTPMQNNLDELQALLKFLRLKPYNDLPRWKQDIIQPMKRGKGGLAMKRLQVFLGVIMKRRTKDILKQEGALNFGGKSSIPASDDALADNEDAATGAQRKQPNGGMQIVKREVETVECDFDPEELEFYLRLQSRADKRINEIKQSGKNDYIGALVLLLRLRQACNHSVLIEMAMSKDKDAMTTGVNGGGSGSQTPRKGSKVEDAEMDDLAALMGGVSVGSKSCDVCQVQLSKEEAKAGNVRCRECEEDLARMRRSKKMKVKKEKQEKKVARGVRNRRVIDSDDDDEDAEGQGEWIGRGAEQRIDLGRAGGSEDEDAEGGGESLGSIDSDRSDDDDEDEEDSPPRARGIRRRPVVKTESDDESEAEEESDAIDSEEEKSILAGLQPIGGKKGHNKPSTKIRHVLRILHAEIPKHKTIVFSQFTSMLDLIEPHLRHSGLRWARYDGSMRPDAREESLRQLRTEPKCRILLCSLKCGSLGLNLTAASRVIIVEPFWNPFVEEQAIDRVHRLNQTVDVKVYRLTVRHTVESQILELQERKRDLAKAAIEGSTKTALGKLTMEDLLGLFRHDAELDDQLHGVEDREMWEKFGSDHRLLDGPSAGFDQVEGLVGRHEEMRRQKPGKVGVRIGKEHDVYGRRW